MALPLPQSNETLEPDLSHLCTEDDTPVDSVFSEKQMRLLTHCLHACWKTERDFVAMANVGLFPLAQNPALVPDVLLSLDVRLPENPNEKGNRSYMVWRYGKPPDLVIEIVSNEVGGELKKAEAYARMGIGYYVIFDPEHWLGEREVRSYVLLGRHYVDLLDVSWIEELGLGLGVWEGTFEGMPGRWLRWRDWEGNFLPTGEERAEAAEEQAEAERSRAEAAEEQAEAERSRAEAAEKQAGAERSRAEAAEEQAGAERSRAEAAEEQAGAERSRAEAAEARAAALAARLRELGLEG